MTFLMLLGMTDARTPHEKQILRQFGEWLKTLRKQSGISQEDLAEKAGFSRSYYTEIETGKRNVSLLNLHRLSVALGVELTDLLLAPSAQAPLEPRIPLDAGFLREMALAGSGLTLDMVKGGISYAYSILDAIDATLLGGNASRLAQMVELANLSSMLGNLLGAGVARASSGVFERNSPHKYPDLLAQQRDAHDIEIKVALENNKPKGHLAKPGYYLTYRYVLCDSSGSFALGGSQRGDVAYVWEARFGYLEHSHFNISNTQGDSGKTAVVNADGMNRLAVVYCDLERCPYSKNSRLYQSYERLFNS